MALETLRGVEEINGVKIHEVDDPDLPQNASICVRHKTNSIHFKIQDGPIKENGKNGCQVEDIVCVAMYMVGELERRTKQLIEKNRSQEK